MNELERIKKLHIDEECPVEIVTLILVCYEDDDDEFTNRQSIYDFYETLSDYAKRFFSRAFVYIHGLTIKEIDLIFRVYVDLVNFDSLIKYTGRSYFFLRFDNTLKYSKPNFLERLNQKSFCELKFLVDGNRGRYEKINSYKMNNEYYFLLRNINDGTEDYYFYHLYSIPYTCGSLNFVRDPKIIEQLKKM